MAGQPVLIEPALVKTAAAFNVVASNQLAGRHGQFVIAAGKVIAGHGAAQMGIDKVRSRNAVAVTEQNVVCAGVKNGFVENPALAKALIRLPYMEDWHRA